jgi:PAS domain S-box-containing protein
MQSKKLPEGKRRIRSGCRKLTEPKVAESTQALLAATLQILNRGGDLHTLIAETLRTIRNSTGFDAVGLRLRQGEDYPYFEQHGFEEEFLHNENFLCSHAENGATLRDAEGRAVLECTCGLVLSARTDTNMTCFTKGGSFWTNASSELLTLSPETDPRTNPRNRCIHSGYESVGLFPLLAGTSIIGLLQLNDRRADRFTPKLIGFYESLAQNIGLGLQRAVADEAKEHSERRFRTLLEKAGESIAVLDATGKITLDISGGNTRLGYTAEEMIGRTAFDLVHPDDLPRVMEMFQNVVPQPNKVEQIEARIRAKDGSWRWQLATGTNLIDDPAVGGIVINSRDITERKQAEAEFRREKILLDSIMRTTDVMLVLLDPQFNFLWVNSAYAETCRMKPEEMIGKNHFALYPHAENEEIFRKVRDTGKGVFYKDKPFVFPDQPEREVTYWDWNLSPVRDTSGNVTGLVFSSRETTKFKQAEDALRRLSQFPEQNPNPVLRVAADCKLLYANKPARDWLTKLGWEADQPLPSAVLKVVADAGGKNRVAESEITSPAGITFWISAIQPAGEDYVNIYGIEVTERKHVETALRESEERLRLFIEHAPASLAMFDREMRYLSVSCRWLTDYNLGGRDLIGLSHYEIFPEIPQFWKTAYRRALAGEVVRAEADRFERVDGSVQWLRWEVRPWRDQRGNIAGIVIFTEDVTSRKQAEEALRENQTRLEAVFATIPYGILEYDADLRLVRANATALNAAGLTGLDSNRDEVAARLKVSDLEGNVVKAEDLPTSRALRGELVAGGLFLITTAAGLKRIVSIYSAPLYKYGEKIGVVALWDDVTERMQAEEALRNLNETLEQRVAERTEEAEARSRELQALAMELLEAEERERRRVADLLHDDLQQILAAARMQLQTACESLPPEPMLANVSQLLEQSIDKSRRLSHELSPAVLYHVGLVAAMQWLAQQMQNQFGLHVQLETDGAQHFESASLKVFLFRAVQELLFNIVKHAGVKTAHVALTGSVSNLTISVSDDGLGFASDILHSPTSMGGFGLMSLRERARYIGGSLTIERLPDQGSRVTLTVPLRLHEADQAEPPQAERPLSSQPRIRSSKDVGAIRVLFVDDHHVMRQGLIRLMNGQSNIHVVGEAANGREAIDRVRQLHPDVVVMDVSMPEMNGIEATRCIKAEFPEVRVIGLSMYEEEHIARSMREAGAEGFVSKTVASAELLRIIYETAGRKPVDATKLKKRHQKKTDRLNPQKKPEKVDPRGNDRLT